MELKVRCCSHHRLIDNSMPGVRGKPLYLSQRCRCEQCTELHDIAATTTNALMKFQFDWQIEHNSACGIEIDRSLCSTRRLLEILHREHKPELYIDEAKPTPTGSSHSTAIVAICRKSLTPGRNGGPVRTIDEAALSDKPSESEWERKDDQSTSTDSWDRRPDTKPRDFVKLRRAAEPTTNEYSIDPQEARQRFFVRGRTSDEVVVSTVRVRTCSGVLTRFV